MRTPATDAMWAAYRAAHPADGPDAGDSYDVASFGDGPAMAEELAHLVLHGPKRATAGLLRNFGQGAEGHGGEPLPRLGGHVVFLGGDGTPRGIWRTTDLRVGPLSSVDDAFAWDEGEGDRTREGWLWLHRAFFARQAAREGWEMTDDEATLFERFVLVWPAPAAPE